MGKVLVTGGAGFIGSHLAMALVEKGNSVRVIDNFSSGKSQNIQAIMNKIELIEGDIRDRKALEKAFNGIEYVYHQAAVPSVPRSLQEPELTHDVNVNGTLAVLMAAKQSKTFKRLVFASSSSVYGNQKADQKSEFLTPQPESPYAAHKLMGEIYCRLFFEQFGIETVALRYFNIFGPRQDPFSEYSAVIPKFIYTLKKGESPTIFGDGEQSRDFTYVDNAVSANLLAAQAPRSVCGKVFNVGAGKSYSVNFLAQELVRLLGLHKECKYLPPRAGDVKHSLADIQLGKQELGYEVLIDFQSGLKKTVESLK